MGGGQGKSVQFRRGPATVNRERLHTAKASHWETGKVVEA